MGDEHHRRAGHAADVEQQVLHLHAGQFVERAERLVHQQQRRPRHQRAAERDALLHAAGELMRPAVGEGREADQIEQLQRALFRRRVVLRPAISIGNSTLASTVRHGSRFGVWNTKPKSSCGPMHLAAADFDAGRGSPRVMPATMRNSVVLPQPLGPSSETSSPCLNEVGDVFQRDDVGRPARGTRQSSCRRDRGRRTALLRHVTA